MNLKEISFVVNSRNPDSRQLEKGHSFREDDNGNIAVVASVPSDLTIVTMRPFTAGLDNGKYNKRVVDILR